MHLHDGICIHKLEYLRHETMFMTRHCTCKGTVEAPCKLTDMSNAIRVVHMQMVPKQIAAATCVYDNRKPFYKGPPLPYNHTSQTPAV